jgi:hypothetical protein
MLKRLLLLITALLGACNVKPPPAPVVVSPTFIQGRYAYLGHGEKLKVLDISTPTQPVVVAELGEAKKLVGQAQVVGDRLYATAWDYQSQADFLIYDLKNPAQPVLLGSFPLGTNYLSRFLVDGRYAYLVTSPDIIVVDVSNGAQPKEVGRVAAQVGQQMVKLGDTLYAAYGICGSRSICQSRFVTVDVRDPAKPVASEHDPQTRFYYSYLASFTADREISLGVSEIVAPNTLGHTLRVYDWREPTAPKLLRTLPTPGLIRAVSGQRALIMPLNSRTVSVAAFTSGGTLEVLREVALPDQAYISDVVIEGNYAYLVLTRPTGETYVQDNILLAIEMR